MLVDAYVDKYDRLILTGTPSEEGHSCDEMGCPSVGPHVLLVMHLYGTTLALAIHALGEPPEQQARKRDEPADSLREMLGMYDAIEEKARKLKEAQDG
jgi:hypothetical protein